MLHFLYVGHFARQGDFIKFTNHADGSLRPVITRPLQIEVVQNALEQKGLAVSSIPEEWGVWLDDGFLVCNPVSHNREAIELIRRLAEVTGCDLADYTSQTLMSPQEFGWEPRVQTEKMSLLHNRVEPIAIDVTMKPEGAKG
jgi:hypothetical protein